MKYEIYFQYTKGWHQIDMHEPSSRGRGVSMINWCQRHDSNKKFHLMTSFDTDLKPIVTAIKFESSEDAMLFAMEWL